MDKLYFCEKCDKIVPEKEVKEIKFFDKVSLHHSYDVMENFYKNQRPGTIGFCPVTRHIFCGKVREPTDQEYFIYHTCNVNK